MRSRDKKTSTSLKSLFSKFSKEFGYVGPSGELTQEFLLERHELITAGLRDFDSGLFFESFEIARSRTFDIGVEYSRDPLVGLLLLRCVDEIFRIGLSKSVPEDYHYQYEMMVEYGHFSFTDWSGRINESIFQQIRSLADPATLVPPIAKRFDDSLRYLLQYGSFRRLGFEIRYEKVKAGEASTAFRRGGLARFNDYTNVHPFLIELCPPHHIWPKFIYDGDFCEVQPDGSLKRTPLDRCDSAKIAEPQKHFPFLHVLNDTETYPPNKI